MEIAAKYKDKLGTLVVATLGDVLLARCSGSSLRVNLLPASLNDRQRYIFIDRYYMAESVEKIASDLAIPVKTAYLEIGKIKKGLRKYLERNGVHV